MSDFADVATSLRGTGVVVGTCITALHSLGGIITVEVGGQQVNCKVSGSLVDPLYWPTNGNLVLCIRAGSTWFVTEVLGNPLAPLDTSTITSDPAPDVRPGFVTGRFVLHPVETATYKAAVGWRDDTTDLFQGQQSGTGRMTGAAFYGTKPSALAGATVTKALVKLRRLAAGPFAAATPTLKLVTEKTKPSGAPTLTSSATGPSLLPNDEADYDIGTTWGQSLVDGTYGGLAIDVAADTPYLRLAGRDSWAAAMAVVIDWRRDG